MVDLDYFNYGLLSLVQSGNYGFGNVEKFDFSINSFEDDLLEMYMKE